MATHDVVQAALGAPVQGDPAGMQMDGIGASCSWDTAQGMDGPEVSVDFQDKSMATWADDAEISKLDPKRSSESIGGHDVIVDPPATAGAPARCTVKLAGDDGPVLIVKAPKTAGCLAVAKVVVSSLSAD